MVAASSKSFIADEKKSQGFVTSSYLINSSELWGQSIRSFIMDDLEVIHGVYAQPRTSNLEDQLTDADLIAELRMWGEASEFDITQAEASLDLDSEEQE